MQERQKQIPRFRSQREDPMVCEVHVSPEDGPPLPLGAAALVLPESGHSRYGAQMKPGTPGYTAQKGTPHRATSKSKIVIVLPPENSSSVSLSPRSPERKTRTRCKGWGGGGRPLRDSVCGAESKHGHSPCPVPLRAGPSPSRGARLTPTLHVLQPEDHFPEKQHTTV